MDVFGRRSWIRTMILVAVAYAVIGIVFSVLDNSADVNQVRLWRLAAWVASAAVAAARIGYGAGADAPAVLISVEASEEGRVRQLRLLLIALRRSPQGAFRTRRRT